MICLKSYIKSNPFFLAPMAGVTDKPFRSFMREMGCGIITSELVSARALKEDNPRTRQLIDFDERQRPYGIQIFGEDPDNIGEGAKRAEGFGADFIDLNLGCPVNKIVRKGAGSALLKDLDLLAVILRALKTSVKIPVSLKVRTGWTANSRNVDKVAHIAFQEGFSWMSVHGRTREQGYSGQADWDYIKEARSKTPLPLVGNGDLVSGAMAVEALRFSGCSAVMIGRGCLNDPWIFLEALYRLKRQSLPSDSLSAFSPENDLFLQKKTERPGEELAGRRQNLMFKKDFRLAIDKLRIYLEDFYDERMFLLQLKKFSAWFSAGFPHSAEFRKSLFQEKDRSAILQKIDTFFSHVQNNEKPAPEYEPFLMRGHG